VTHMEPSAIDLDLARRRHEGYVTVLAEHGWRVHEVPPADDCPDSVFIEANSRACRYTPDHLGRHDRAAWA
jgi:dimethylargininase